MNTQNEHSMKKQNTILTVLLTSTQLPVATYKKTIIFYIIACLFMLSISISSFFILSETMYQSVLYYVPTHTTNCSHGQICVLEFELNQPMSAPIYVLYQLDGFYQNHRRYIQSKSNYQLAGNTLQSTSQASICSPYITNKQMNISKSWGGESLNPDDVASPCGAIAKTYFNDEFKLNQIVNDEKAPIFINETGISWPGDKGHKYKRSAKSKQTQWIDPEDEHFIVWMRTSGLPNFKKLWGRIQTDLAAGKYQLEVQNNFKSENWEGDRYFILSENSAFGGQNYTIPIVFLILGAGCLIVGCVFFIRWRRQKKKEV